MGLTLSTWSEQGFLPSEKDFTKVLEEQVFVCLVAFSLASKLHMEGSVFVIIVPWVCYDLCSMLERSGEWTVMAHRLPTKGTVTTYYLSSIPARGNSRVFPGRSWLDEEASC